MSDALIIGGGIIGLLTARELAGAGAKVSLIEMGEVGKESTWAGGGIISPLYPWRYADSVTVLASWSQHQYPGLCEALREESGIDAEYTRSGLLILDAGERDRVKAWAARHSHRLEILDPTGVARLEPELPPAPEGAVWMPEIAQVRNPRLGRAAHYAVRDRVEIHEHAEVLELTTAAGRITGARTRTAHFEAEKVIVCTGAWTGKLLAQLGEKPDIEPVRGQMIVFLSQPGQIRHIALQNDRYIIPRRDGRVLVGSTLEYAGFMKTTTAEAKEALYRSAVEMFPFLRHTPIENHWAGLRPGSPSGIPFIGAYPGIDGLFFNAGHFRNGVTLGPASARLAADLVLGRAPILPSEPYALDAKR